MIFFVVHIGCNQSYKKKEMNCIDSTEYKIYTVLDKEFESKVDDFNNRGINPFVMEEDFSFGTDSCKNLTSLQINTTLGFPKALYTFKHLKKLRIMMSENAEFPVWSKFADAYLHTLEIEQRSDQPQETHRIEGKCLAKLKFLSIKNGSSVFIDPNLKIETIHLWNTLLSLDCLDKKFMGTKKLLITGYAYSCCIEDFNFASFPDLETLEYFDKNEIQCDSLKTLQYIQKLMEKNKKIKKIRYNKIEIEGND